MRELESHKINSCNDQLRVLVKDEPGPGGACHEYSILTPIRVGDYGGADIRFQKGAIKESGINGITSEALLAVLIDRHEGFQNGSYPSSEGGEALRCMKEALQWLHKRTGDRISRGVEGIIAK